MSHCLFSLHVDYILQNTGLDKSQAGLNITQRNIHNLRYADHIAIMADSDEELNSLLLRVKEESEKASLKLNIN